MKYLLTERKILTASSILLTFEPKNSRGIGFWPGQYAALRFTRLGRPTPARCFSIVNRPNDQGILQFAVKVEGQFTTALQELPLNSAVDIDGSFGEFVYDRQFDQNSVFLAGGIGITPIMSILAAAVTEGAENTFTLFYSVRDQKDAPFADELLALEKTNSRFRVVFFVSKGDTSRFDSSHVVSGRISKSMLTKAARQNFETTSFFLCGSASFMDDMTEMLSEQGTPAIRINNEAFTQAKAVVERGARRSLSQLMFSTYGLAAVAFMLIIGAITTTDLLAHSTLSAEAAAKLSSLSDDAPRSNSGTPAPTITATPAVTSTAATPSVTTAPTQSRTYQQPVSTVS